MLPTAASTPVIVIVDINSVVNKFIEMKITNKLNILCLKKLFCLLFPLSSSPLLVTNDVLNITFLRLFTSLRLEYFLVIFEFKFAFDDDDLVSISAIDDDVDDNDVSFGEHDDNDVDADDKYLFDIRNGSDNNDEGDACSSLQFVHSV